MDNKKYDSQKIKVLKGLEAVKTRPGMYIGNTEDGTGLHHMIYEVLDNSVDEALAGYCSKIHLTLLKDGKVKIDDNGRGIPIDVHPVEHIPTPEVVFTTLHSGGKFDQESYGVSGGLHGVGISVVNALSDFLYVEIKRDRLIYRQYYQNGFPSPCQYAASELDETGTSITFLPSKEVFKDINFNFDELKNRVREIAFLNPNVTINLSNLITNEEYSFAYSKGLVDFLQHISDKEPIGEPIHFSQTKGTNKVQVVLKWVQKDFEENIKCYTNNIPQIDGGSHLLGFKMGVSKAIQNFITQELNSKTLVTTNITSEDTRAGLVAIVCIHTPNPIFSSQTKEKLVNSSIKADVESITSDAIFNYLMENIAFAKQIIEHISIAAKSRIASRQARDINRQTKSQGIIHSLAGKLAFCKSKEPELCELFLVEGDSAAGPAKQARNKQYQAILPLRGKILNVEKTSIAHMLKSNEILNILTALGVQLNENFNINKLQYHKIIIMTDADIDGRHINTLLLTLFYRYLKPIIDQGYLYLAQPPLYSCILYGKHVFIRDDDHILDICKDSILSKYQFLSQKKEIKDPQVFLDRYLRIDQVIRGYLHSLPENIIEALGLIEFIDIADADESQDIADADESHNIKDTQSLIQKEWKSNFLSYLHHNSQASSSTYAFQTDSFNLLTEEDGCTKLYPLETLLLSENYKPLLEDFQTLYGMTNISVISKSFKNDYPTLYDAIKSLFQHEKFHAIKSLKRYKGLGEMNFEELGISTMHPQTRNILKVTIEDAQRANELFDILMGTEVESRREFIISHSKYVTFKI